jgi:hypothetical protein
VNAAYVRRFLELTQARGIAVYWLIPPVRDDVQERRERLGVDARYQLFVQHLQAKFANLSVIDGRRAGFERDLFRDPLHLDRQGALGLSAGVAEVLAAGQSKAQAWVALPGPHPWDVNVAVEDLEQSRVAVQALPRGPGR